MIVVQWADGGEMCLQGQQYYDEEYADAMLDYEKRRGNWGLVRVILTHNDLNPAKDWVIIHRWECIPNPMDGDLIP